MDSRLKAGHVAHGNRKEKSMSLKIRLSRGGAKKRPFYRVVIADARSPRDGRFIEKIGTFDPLNAKDAQPTDRVARLLDGLGLIKRTQKNNPQQGTPKKKAQERAAAAAKAAES